MVTDASLKGLWGGGTMMLPTVPNSKESLNMIVCSKYFLSLNFCPSWHDFGLPLFVQTFQEMENRQAWQYEKQNYRKTVNFKRIRELRTSLTSKYFPFCDEYLEREKDLKVLV